MRISTLIGLGFLLIAGLLVVGLIATDAGELELTWFGYEIRTSAALAVAVVALIFAVGALILRIFGAIARTPKRWRAARALKRAQDREAAMLEGLAASAAGDVRAMRRAAATLSEGDGSPAAAFFDARAAQVEGDRGGAERALRRLVDQDATAILGLRGLLGQAIARDDRAGARDLAERAFSRAPGAEWAFQAHVRLSAEAGHWDAVLRALEVGARHGFVADAGPARAAALLARSARRRADGDAEGADADALDAHKLDFLSPVAMSEAAKVWIHRDKRRRAEKLVEEGWRMAPHPALAEAYDAACGKTAGREARAERLITLAALNAGATESRLLRAAQHAALGKWREAREALEPLLEDPRPGRRAYRLMGDIILGEQNDMEAAREWYDRALAAPPETHLRGWRAGAGFDLAGRGGVQAFLRAIGLSVDEDLLDQVTPASLPGPRPMLGLEAPGAPHTGVEDEPGETEQAAPRAVDWASERDPRDGR